MKSKISIQEVKQSYEVYLSSRIVGKMTSYHLDTRCLHCRLRGAVLMVCRQLIVAKIHIQRSYSKEDSIRMHISSNKNIRYLPSNLGISPHLILVRPKKATRTTTNSSLCIISKTTFAILAPLIAPQVEIIIMDAHLRVSVWVVRQRVANLLEAFRCMCVRSSNQT